MTAGKFSPITVTSTGAVNLADANKGGIPETGDFHAGAMITVTLTFSDGEKVSVQTPVVTQCHEFESVVPQVGGKSGHGKASSEPSTQTSDEATTEPASEPTPPYDCSFPSLPAVGE
jgi:hypothetical protein